MTAPDNFQKDNVTGLTLLHHSPLVNACCRAGIRKGLDQVLSTYTCNNSGTFPGSELLGAFVLTLD